MLHACVPGLHACVCIGLRTDRMHARAGDERRNKHCQAVLPMSSTISCTTGPSSSFRPRTAFLAAVKNRWSVCCCRCCCAVLLLLLPLLLAAPGVNIPRANSADCIAVAYCLELLLADPRRVSAAPSTWLRQSACPPRSSMAASRAGQNPRLSEGAGRRTTSVQFETVQVPGQAAHANAMLTNTLRLPASQIPGEGLCEHSQLQIEFEACG